MYCKRGLLLVASRLTLESFQGCVLSVFMLRYSCFWCFAGDFQFCLLCLSLLWKKNPASRSNEVSRDQRCLRPKMNQGELKIDHTGQSKHSKIKCCLRNRAYVRLKLIMCASSTCTWILLVIQMQTTIYVSNYLSRDWSQWTYRYIDIYKFALKAFGLAWDYVPRSQNLFEDSFELRSCFYDQWLEIDLPSMRSPIWQRPAHAETSAQQKDSLYFTRVITCPTFSWTWDHLPYLIKNMKLKLTPLENIIKILFSWLLASSQRK